MITAGLIVVVLALVLGGFAWMIILAKAADDNNANAGCVSVIVGAVHTVAVVIVGIIIGWVNTRI